MARSSAAAADAGVGNLVAFVAIAGAAHQKCELVLHCGSLKQFPHVHCGNRKRNLVEVVVFNW